MIKLKLTPMPSPKKINIVMFWFNNDWGLYGRAYEQIAKALTELSEVGKIVCVFPPTKERSKSPYASIRHNQVSPSIILLEEEGDVPKRPKRSHFKAYILYLILTLQKDMLFRAFLWRNGIRSRNTMLWLFPPNPYIHRILALAPHFRVVTQIVDDFTKFNPDHILYKHAHSQYPEVGKWSDIIFVTSKANHDKFAAVGRPCRLYYPAVDRSFLGKPSQLPYKTSGKAPRLGYLGYIMDRTDLALIKFVAEQRPQWEIILAGPEYPDGYLSNSGLLCLSNITYLGAIHQQNAPRYLESLDICLLPHRDNEYSRSMGPLKLYQYLASGRPVVSTNIAGLDLARDHIYIANNKYEFVEHIETALYTDTPEISLQRIEIARANTWHARVREMLFDIDKLIESGQSGSRDPE